jgi:hypothetical protein
MPSLSNLTTKQWGKADKAFLHQLIVNGNAHIKDLSTENIYSIQAWYFTHCTQRNFRRNFKDFAAAFNLKLGLAGARGEPNEGKMHI